MSKTVFKRATHLDNYVVMKTTGLRDRDLTWQAKGLHSYLLQLPDDWEINMTDLEKRAKNGRDSLYSIVTELEISGYFRKEIQREKGRFAGIVYHVFEEPVIEKDEKDSGSSPFPENPDTVKPDTVKPFPENPTLLNTNINNNLSNQVFNTGQPADDLDQNSIDFFKSEIQRLNIKKDSVVNRSRIWQIFRPYLKTDEFKNSWPLIAGKYASQVEAEELIRIWILKSDRFDQVKNLQINKVGGWVIIHANKFKNLSNGKQQTAKPPTITGEPHSGDINEF